MGTARHPDAANLNATVDQPRFGIAAAFDGEFQFEILEALFCRDEVVLVDFLRPRSAGDHAVLDTPDFGIEIPAIERFAVEEGDGFGRFLGNRNSADR